MLMTLRHKTSRVTPCMAENTPLVAESFTMGSTTNKLVGFGHSVFTSKLYILELARS